MPHQYEKPMVSGDVHIELYDRNGNLKLVRDIKNIVVNGGLGYIASRMVNADMPVMSHMAVGSDSTQQEPSDTDLGSILDDRVPIQSTNIIGDHLEKIKYLATFFPGVSTGAIVESGVFNDGTSGEGTMLCRTTFPVVNKQEDDTMAIEWTISITNNEE